MSKLIILDSGHAKNTAGKRSPDSSLMEWEFNNAMQYLIKKRLEELGFTVYLTNPDPANVKDIGLSTRARSGNNKWSELRKPEALFISLHANAAGSNGAWANARGVEVYHAGNASQKSKNAAAAICNSIFNGVYNNIDKGFKNRGVKSANFTVIHKAECPSILIEYAFYDNKEDIKLLKTYRSQLAEYTVQGICKCMGVSYRASKVVQPQPPKKEEPKPEKQTFYRVITGSFTKRENAEAEKEKLQKMGLPAFLITAVVKNVTYFRVVAVSTTDKKDANLIVEALKKNNIASYISTYTA